MKTGAGTRILSLQALRILLFFALSQILIITAKIDVISPNLIRKNTSRCYDELLRPIGSVFGTSSTPFFRP